MFVFACVCLCVCVCVVTLQQLVWFVLSDCCSVDPSPEPPRTQPRTQPLTQPQTQPQTQPGPHRGRTPSLSGERRLETPSLRTTRPRSVEHRGRTASLSRERSRGSSPPHLTTDHQETPQTLPQESLGEDQSGAPSRASLTSLSMRRIQARNQQRLQRLDRGGLDLDLSSGENSELWFS